MAGVLKKVEIEGFTEKELDDVRGAWLQQRGRWLSDESQVSNLLASNLYWDRDMQWWSDFDAKLKAASLADSNAAIRKYLSADQLFVVDAGDYKP